jgi:threonine/homoserine/homoserine lactone efflux protein
MNDAWVFARGATLGFSIAAPVGPIGVLCIRRTLADGRWVGLATGLGAAAADGVYGTMAAFGLDRLAHAMAGHAFWIKLLGGAFLLYLGVTTWLSKPSERAATANGAGLLGAFVSTFLLTISNPMTILAFLAVFASLGLGVGAHSWSRSLLLVIGVILGSALWWLILSGIASRLRSRFDARAMRWVNRGSGALISSFGVFAVATAFRVSSGAR